jgi:hypothetical protein
VESVLCPSTQAFLYDVLTMFPAVKYTYTFDSMGRPNKLTGDAASPVDWGKNAAYVSEQLLCCFVTTTTRT